MEDSYFKYIIPVFDSIHTCGLGCFVGDFFITSGHVVGSETKYLFWNGECIPLEPNNAMSLQCISEEKNDNRQNDFALFRFTGINSPLMLSECPPSVGAVFDCITWVPNNDTSKVDGFIRRLVCKGEVISIFHHFFSCKMDYVLQEGASGSPLIIDGIVWGILSGHDENKGKDELFFQSAAFIHSLFQS